MDISKKALLRAGVLARRCELTREEITECSEAMVEPGVRLCEQFRPQVVGLYHPIRNEVGSFRLASRLAQNGFDLALPISMGSSLSLFFRCWRLGDDLQPSTMGIPEPPQTSAFCEPDLLFVPICGFDRRGFRIGYGAGYYDRSLRVLRSKRRTLAFGMAYAFQELEKVPNEPHDEPLDGILTERELILC